MKKATKKQNHKKLLAAAQATKFNLLLLYSIECGAGYCGIAVDTKMY